MSSESRSWGRGNQGQGKSNRGQDYQPWQSHSYQWYETVYYDNSDGEYKYHVYEYELNEDNSEGSEDVADSIEKRELSVQSDKENEVDINFTDCFYIKPLPKQVITCCRCDFKFPLNNQLHKHLKYCWNWLKTTAVTLVAISENLNPIREMCRVRSNTTPVSESGLSFWSWHYATLGVTFSFRGNVEQACEDTDCMMTLIDWVFFWAVVKDTLIQMLEKFISICRIDSTRYQSAE